MHSLCSLTFWDKDLYQNLFLSQFLRTWFLYLLHIREQIQKLIFKRNISCYLKLKQCIGLFLNITLLNFIISIGTFFNVAFSWWLITKDKVYSLWKLDSMIFVYLTNNVAKDNASLHWSLNWCDVIVRCKLKLFTYMWRIVGRCEFSPVFHKGINS